MDSPIDDNLVRLCAQADRVRVVLREEVLDLPVPRRRALFRQCAEGNLSGLDEHLQMMVGNLAILTMLAMGVPYVPE